MWSFLLPGERKYSPYVAVMLIALFVVTLGSGCGSDKEFEKVREQLATVEKERDEFKKRVQSLEEDNATLKKKVDEQMEEIGALKRRLTDAGIAETADEANFDACKKNLKDIATALKLYASDSSGLYPKTIEKITLNRKYLEFIPTCPSVTRDTYAEGYEVTRDKKAFTVSCMGHNHGQIFIKENYPQYSSVSGVLVEKEEKKEPTEDEEEEESEKTEPSPTPSATP